MAKKMKKKAILWKVLGCLVMSAIVMSGVQSLFIFSASAVPIIPSPGVDTDKSSICCGDYITVNVPVKNLRSVSKTVSVYIEIKDPKGNKKASTVKSVTLSAHGSTTVTARLKISKPCNYFGTYTVKATVKEGSTVHDTDTTTFKVKDCEPQDTCRVYVKIDDPCCVGYKVYVDGVYQFTEGQSGTPDGYCAFYVDEGTHTLKITKNSRSESKKINFQCNIVYRWVSMPKNWCGDGEAYVEIKDKYCKGYVVYVDGNYQFTEGQSGTPDGNCGFFVGVGTHTIEIRKNSRSADLTKYFECGYRYTWESMPKNWCEPTPTPPPQKPDLIIKDISWSPSNPDEGDTIKFTVKVKNQGLGSAESSTVKYYVDGSYVDYDSVPALSADSTSTKTFTWTANKCGNVQVKAVADAYNAVDPESNEGNNDRTGTINVICREKPAPEIVEVKYPPACVKEGDAATISVTVENKGGTSNEGYISVSFPNGEDVSVVSGTGNGYNKLYPKGSEIWGKDGKIPYSKDPLVDLLDTNWVKYQQETITMNVKPNSGSDEIVFYVRAALKNADGTYERDPTYSGDKDQQGWCVERHVIDVCPKEACVIIDDDTCAGYEVYVDGASILTEGVGEILDGYCTFSVTEGTHTIEIRDNSRYAAITRNFEGTYTWDSMPDNWCKGNAAVKFRGVIVKETQPISFYNYKVKIEDILEDPSDVLNPGDEVWVWAHADGPAKVDSVSKDDKVEVSGTYDGELHREVKLETGEHYLRALKVSVIIDDDTCVGYEVWVDGAYKLTDGDGDGYCSFSVAEGTHTIEIRDNGCTASITRIFKGTHTWNSMPDNWCKGDAAVKFKGVIVKDSSVSSFFNYKIKINDVLTDPSDVLNLGDEIWVWAISGGPSQVDSVGIDDKVEVYGTYDGELHREVKLETAEHYLKKISQEILISNYPSLFHANSYLVVGENAASIDMIGGIKLINELAYTGSSIVPLLDSEASGDTAHNILAVGGPMANSVTSDLNNDMGIGLSSDATKYTISISGWKTFDVPKSWEGSEDLAIVAVREIDGKNKLVIWGITGQGTWAACNYISDLSFRSNIDTDTAIIHWKDMDADGVVSNSDIVELYGSKSTTASSTNSLTKKTIYKCLGHVSTTDGNYYVLGAEAKGIDTIGAYDIARLDSRSPTVNLDIDVLNKQDIPDNVISIGGPAANKFTKEKGNGVGMSKISTLTHEVTAYGKKIKIIADDVAVIYSQNNGGKSPIFIWGWTAKGTRAGCKYYANHLQNQELGDAVSIIEWKDCFVDGNCDGNVDDGEISLYDTIGTLPPKPLLINAYITVYHDVVTELLKTPKGAHAIKLCNLNFNTWSKDFSAHAKTLVESLGSSDAEKFKVIMDVFLDIIKKIRSANYCIDVSQHILYTNPKSEDIKSYVSHFNWIYYDDYNGAGEPIERIFLSESYRTYLFYFEDLISNAEHICTIHKFKNPNEKKYECAQFFARHILLPFTDEMIESAVHNDEKKYLVELKNIIDLFSQSKSIKDENGVIISLESPALLHAYDQYGRHVGVNLTDST